ncbi:YadA-like family protein [Pseudomonas sp. ADAK2]|uniref:YadA-like family protein n=1 Tax=Pseudomonas sp. ADAK2 TaxID=2730845 RepID=UPI0023517BF2|nr:MULTISPECIES: YadA-like family protein [unclassified Pseudomonas]
MTSANSVALGSNSLADGTKLTTAAYGVGGTATAGGEVNIANGVNGRRITGLAAGASATDAVNVSQLNQLGQSTATALGGGAALNATTGAWTAPSYSTNSINAVGTSTGPLISNNVGAALTNLNTSLTNTAAVAVKYDNAATKTQVTFNPAGTAVKLTNIAVGVLNATSTDAVNGSQLFTDSQNTATALGGGAAVNAATGAWTAPSYSTNSINAVGTNTGPLVSTNVGAALINLNTSLTNTAAVAVKYDDATTKTQVTFNPAGTSVKLTNVAAGALSGTSTEAVNGSQLFATNQTLNSINNGAGIKYFHANSTQADSTATGLDSVAIGPLASATVANGVALGANSSATGTTLANAAYGVGGTATAGGEVNIGNGADGRRLTGLAAGSQATDAVNVSQLNKVGQDTATALGGGAALNGTAGTWTAPSYSTNSISVNGTNTGPLVSNNVGAALTNLNTSVTNTAAVAVKYDDATTKTQVTFNPAGTAVKLTNVAAGTLNGTSTDAVNGAQLFATNQTVNSLSNGGGIKYFHTNSTLADSSATGQDSVAVGPAASSTATNAVAIGNGAVAGDANSVALGNGATTAAAVATASSVINGTTYNYAGTAPIGVLSVGSAGNERQITNVAAGQVSAASTDAVNGSQLFSTNTAVNGLGTQVNNLLNNGTGIKYFHSNSTLADSTATGVDSVAVGPASSSTAANAVAIGNGAIASTANSIALGNGATTAAAVATASGVINGTTFNYAGAAPTGVLSVGSAGNERQITNVAAGQVSAASTDAVNGSQLFSTNTAVNGLGTQVNNLLNNGTGIKYFHSNSTLADSTATGVDSVAVGPASSSTAANAVAIGNGAIASTANSIALGNGATTAAAVATASGVINGANFNYAGAAPTGVLSVGSAGNERQITNVAAGQVSAASTDAVNGSQLFSTNTAVNGLGTQVNNLLNNGTGIKYFHSNSTLADSTATGVDSVAVGPASSSTAANAVAIGNGAIASTANSIALGNGATTAAAVATASGVINGANFNYAGAAPTGVLSVGSAGNERQITNVAAGQVSAASTDAVNGSQLFSTNTAVNGLGTQVDSLLNNGTGIKYFHSNSTLADSTATGLDSVSVGPTANASATNAVAIGNGAVAGTANSVALGNGATTAAAVATASGVINGTTYNYAGAAPTGVLSVGSAGNERQITNVAAGQVSATSTDAVNGSQLFSTNTAVNGLGTQVDSLLNNGTGIKYFHSNSTLADSTATGVDSVAIGPVSIAAGANSFAAGSGSNATADGGLALGHLSQVQVLGGIALGEGSVADRALAPATGTIPVGSGAIVYDTSDATLLGSVSVGKAGSYRQITNVADATQDHDAVTLRQLTGAMGSLSSTGTRYFHTNSTNPADSLSTGAESVAVGPATVVNGDNGIGIGNQATVGLAGAGGIAIGRNTQVLLASGIAMGSAAQAGAEQSVALGAGANASQAMSVALGSSSVNTVGAETNYSAYRLATPQTSVGEIGVGTALGNRKLTGLAAGTQDNDGVNVAQLKSVGDQVDQNTTSITNLDGRVGGLESLVGSGGGIKYLHVNSTGVDSAATGIDSMALGPNAQASGNASEAIGSGASASATGSVALGAGANASQAMSVALGSDSLTSVGAESGYSAYHLAAPQTSVGEIGIGTAAGNRKLTGLSAGTQDNDAVNVAQLKSVGDQVDQNTTNITNLDGRVGGLESVIGSGGGIKYLHVNSSSADSAASGSNSMALGPNAQASGSHSVAIGNGAKASADGSVALGSDSSDGGRGAETYTGQYSGVNNVSSGTVSVGDAATGTTRTVSNVADGKDATDAVNVRQLDGAVAESKQYTDDSIANLNGAAVQQGARISTVEGDVSNIKNGTDGMFQVSNGSAAAKPKATGVDSIAGGAGAMASGKNSAAVGTQSQASGENSVALGNGAKASAKNATALGANAVADRENSVSVGSVGNERQLTNIAAGTSGTDAVNVDQLTKSVAGITDNANAYTDQRYSELKNDIKKQDETLSAGIAGAMAMASLPQSYSPGASMTTAAASTYRGQAALAFGVSHLSGNGRWLTKVQGSTDTQRNVGVAVGVGYQW